jgi:hypothetical protein
MNFSRVEKIGSQWASVAGADGKPAMVWAKFRSKRKAEEHAIKLAEVTKGEYRGLKA